VLVGPVFAFNVGLVLAPVVSAWPMYVLVRRLVGRSWIATTTATMWALSPYVLANLPLGRFHQTVQFIEPVVMLLALDLVQGRRRPVTVGLLGAAAIVVQYFTGSEQLAMVAFEVGLGLVVAAFLFRSTLLAVARRALVALAVAGVSSAIVLAYPLWVEFFGPRHTTGSPWGAIYEYGDTLRQIVATPHLFGHGDRTAVLIGSPGAIGENLAFLGWGVVVSCLVVMVWQRRDRRVAGLGIVGGLTVVFELGVTIQMSASAQPLSQWAPWRLFAALPVVEQLIPDRFAQMVAFAALLLLAIGWSTLHDHLAATTRSVRSLVLAVAVGFAVLPQVLGAPVPFPSSTNLPGASRFSSLAATAQPNERVLVFPSIDEGFGTSSAPMTLQALTGFRFDLVGGYVLVPTTHGTASAWLVPPTGDEAAIQHFMSIFTVSRVTAAERAEIAHAIRVRKVTSVVLLPIIGNNNLAEAELTATMGTLPRQRNGILAWRHLKDVHPLTVSDAVIEGCAAATSGRAPIVTARCVLAAAGHRASKTPR
jgi:hypothetical protein